MRVLVSAAGAGSPHRLVSALRAAGLAVDLAATRDESEVKPAINQYDCLVVVQPPPGGDGAALIRRLRADGMRTPALLLDHRHAPAGRIEGFSAGADDCVSAPFVLAELVARVRALCRRSGEIRPALLRLGDLTVDLSRRHVTRSEVALSLPPKQFAVLELLASRADEVVTRGDLIECCWDEMADPRSNVVDAVMARLRRRLGPPPIIHSVPGIGFRLSPLEVRPA